MGTQHFDLFYFKTLSQIIFEIWKQNFLMNNERSAGDEVMKFEIYFGDLGQERHLALI